MKDFGGRRSYLTPYSRGRCHERVAVIRGGGRTIQRQFPHQFGTHSLRRTKATLIYRRTGNLRAIQLLLGHTKIESTVRYLGIEVDDPQVAQEIRVNLVSRRRL
jgi:integrase